MQRLAIIIPAYNAGSTIEETLVALHHCREIQSVGGVFVCDDASEDDTIQRANACWKLATEFRVLRNSRNLGERATVNAAIECLAREYEWVAILHADDVVKENWISLVLAQIATAANNVASICSSYDSWFPSEGRIVPGEDDFSREVEIINGTRESVLDTLARGCWWHISGCAIRISHFSQIGGFRTDMPQLGDWEWLLRCLKMAFSVAYIPRTTMFYRLHSRSVSSNSFQFGRDLIEESQLFVSTVMKAI